MLGKQYGGVFEVGEPRFRGRVALVGLFGERGVLVPRDIGHLLRLGEQLVGIDGAQQCVAQADLRDADLLQGGDGGDALLVHLCQSYDERLERRGGVAVPQRLELLRRHARHAGKILQRLPARGRSDLHVDQRLGKRRAAHLRAHAHRRQRRREAQYLRLAQADLVARRGKTQRHVHDVGLGGGEVVAQVHQRRAQIAELRLVHAGDVGKLRQRGGGVLGDDVGGVAQIDHGAGEVHQIVVLDAQLPGDGHGLVDLRRRGSHLCRHRFGRRSQGVELRFRGVHGLAHAGERGLEVQRRLDRRRAHGKDGRGDGGGERAARALIELSAGGDLFAEGLEVLPCLRPRGTRRGQLPVGLFDLRARAGDGGPGAVEGGLRVEYRVRRLLRLLRVVGLLRGAQLFLCPAQHVLILRQRLLLDLQLVVEQGHPGGEAGNAGIDVLDARRGQFEAALRNGDLLSEAGNGGIARFYSTPGRVPAGLRQAQRLVAGGDLRGGLLDGGACAVQLRLGRGKSVGGVLRGLFQRHLLAFQLLDLSRLLAVFFLDEIKIAFGRDGGGVRLAQRVAVLAVGARRAGDFLFELCLPVLCLFKPPGIFALPGVAFLQLVAGLLERAPILADGVLLQGHGALERVQLGRQPGSGLFKALHARAGQFEGGLRLLDLLLHGADVAGKVVAVERQRYDQIAERFAQKGFTCLCICGSALDKTGKIVYTLYKPTWEGCSCRYPSNRGGTARGSVFPGNFSLRRASSPTMC